MSNTAQVMGEPAHRHREGLLRKRRLLQGRPPAPHKLRQELVSRAYRATPTTIVAMKDLSQTQPDPSNEWATRHATQLITSTSLTETRTSAGSAHGGGS